MKDHCPKTPTITLGTGKKSFFTIAMEVDIREAENNPFNTKIDHYFSGVITSLLKDLKIWS
jgi:hypothetical protein